jgi:hypothetical protein
MNYFHKVISDSSSTGLLPDDQATWTNALKHIRKNFKDPGGGGTTAHNIVKPNCDEFTRSPNDIRLLWNVLVSMNTVPEILALQQREYPPYISRSELHKLAEEIRQTCNSTKPLRSPRKKSLASITLIQLTFEFEMRTLFYIFAICLAALILFVTVDRVERDRPSQSYS